MPQRPPEALRRNLEGRLLRAGLLGSDGVLGDPETDGCAQEDRARLVPYEIRSEDGSKSGSPETEQAAEDPRAPCCLSSGSLPGLFEGLFINKLPAKQLQETLQKAGTSVEEVRESLRQVQGTQIPLPEIQMRGGNEKFFGGPHHAQEMARLAREMQKSPSSPVSLSPTQNRQRTIRKVIRRVRIVRAPPMISPGLSS